MIEQVALLSLRRSELSLLVIEKLRQPAPLRGHYEAIAARGYAMKPGAGSYHKLTPAGLRAADICAKAFAGLAGVHFFYTSETQYNCHIRCTCGWSATHSKNEGHIAAKQSHSRERHLASVGTREHAADSLGTCSPADESAATNLVRPS